MTSDAPAAPASSARKVNFVRAFLVSALGTGLSRVLGAARESVVAWYLGVGASSDAFNLAWTIPNVFRRFVADEGLTGAMIPALARAEADGGRGELQKLGSSAFAALCVANVVLVTLGIVFAEPLVLAFAWSWRDDPEHLALAVSMTRIMFPFVAMVSTVSYFEGLLNYRGHFFVPKVAPALISAGVVTAAAITWSWPERPVHALVLGTLAGGLTHVLVHVPVLWSSWGRLGIVFDFRSPRVRGIAREMSKVIAIGLFAQLNLLVLQQLATSLPPGSLTIYRNSTQLTDLAQGIVAVAIGSALLPNISVSVSNGQWDQFRAELGRAIRLASFLLIPAAAVLLCYGTPVTSMLFRAGKYRWEDVQLTASALQFLSPFVLGVAGINILKKVYFALEDRGTLLRVGAFGVVLTGGVGFALTRPFGLDGLVSALSVSTILQLGTYLWLLRRRLGAHVGLGALVVPLARIIGATIPLGLVLWLAVPLGHWEDGPLRATNWVVFFGGFAAAGAVYLLGAWLLGVEEVATVLARARARVRR